jgi:hypothetical protein
MAMQDRECAKQIILEIIRQAGGVLNYKTSLFKAFYHAHLRFADTHPGYLSAWPIVRMPRGPGIDRFDVLLGELMAEDRITTKEIEIADYRGFQFALCGQNSQTHMLPEGAEEAIAYGVQQVRGKSATQVSAESHQVSRAWREANNGDELNVYLDSMSDADYDDYMRRAKGIKSTLDEVWPQGSSIPRVSPI